MCGSHSEGSLLPILAWKLRMMQAGAEIEREMNVPRSAAPKSGSGKAGKKKTKATAKRRR